MTREEAIETLRANYPDKCYESLRNAVDVAIESLKAEPVKHGRWIPAQDYSNGNEDIECSNCGEWFKSLELCGRLGEPNYCPVCGTKMEENKQN